MHKIFSGLRRVCSLALALVFILGLSLSSYADGLGNPPGNHFDTSKLVPDFGIDNGGNLGAFGVGKDHVFKFKLTNLSEFTSDKTTIELVPNKDEIKIFAKSDLYRQGILIRPGKSHEVEMPFRLNEAIEQKTYNMTLKLTFYNLYGNNFTKEIPVYFYVENYSLLPNVGIVQVETERDIVDAKEPQKLTLTVGNGGDLRARNIIITLNGFNSKGVNLVGDFNIRKLDTLAKGMKQVITFNIIGNEDLDKDVEIEAKISYIDDIDKPYEKTQTIFLKTQEKKEKPDISLVDMSFSKENYEIFGEGKSSAKLLIENKGSATLKDLDLRLSAEGGVKFMSKNVDIIKELKPGEKKSFNYLLASADPAQSGSYPITATLKTGVGETAAQVIQVAGVTCYKKEEEKDGEKKGGKKPKIIIADYSYNAEKIIAGKEFILTLVFKNTSQNMGVKNVKFTFTSDDGMFIPIDSANSFFIDHIAPESTAAATIKLKTKPEAAVKMYNMTFIGEYEDMNGVSYDEKGNPYKAEELISLNVRQEARLQIPEFKLPTEAYVGMPINFDIEFYNLGKASLYNTVVKIEGEDFDKDPAEYFAGNFEAAKSDIFSTKLTPLKAGELKGRVVFKFEDEAGNPSEVAKEFTIMVGEGAGLGPQDEMQIPPGDMDGVGEMPEFDENGNPIQKGFSPWLIAGIVLGVLIVLFVVYKIIKKRRMKALEAKLLEEDDEN